MLATLATALMALQGQHAVGVSADLTLQPETGGGVTARWAWCIDAYWGLTAAAAWHKTPEHSARGSLGVHYLFDDYEWVPWGIVALEGVGRAAEGEGLAGALALDLEVGLDWRITPVVSLGVLGSWHPVLVGDAPALSTVALRVSTWW